MNARTLTAVVLAVILIAVIPAGASPTSEGSGSTARSSGIDAPVQFINISETVGLTGIRSGNNWAWGDYDNDGDEDLLILGTVLFATTASPDGISQMFRRRQASTTRRHCGPAGATTTTTAGLTSSAATSGTLAWTTCGTTTVTVPSRT